MFRTIAAIASCFMLFVLAGCGKRSVIAESIPDGENIFFTSQGRLFVTGGTNIFEISDEGNGVFAADELSDGGMFLGMAEFENYFYVLLAKFTPDPNGEKVDLREIFEPGGAKQVLYNLRRSVSEYVLLRAPLIADEPLSFEELYTFEDASMPNGMVVDQQGRLYITDTTYFPLGKIIRIDPHSSPLTMEDWLTTDDGITSPNGIAISGNKLYFTDLDLSNLTRISRQVKAVSIDVDSGKPGPIHTVFERIGPSLFDDLIIENISGENVLVVTDYFEGRLIFLVETKAGVTLLHETAPGYFACPTSVARGQGDFDSDSLLVTEKGVIFEHTSRIGNKLTLYSMGD